MDSNHDFSHFTIAVIGLGLMGGSFAKRFKAIGSRVIGINRTASVAQEALRMGIVDSISYASKDEGTRLNERCPVGADRVTMA